MKSKKSRKKSNLKLSCLCVAMSPSLLAPSMATAQQAPPALSCANDSCTTPEGLLFHLRTRSYSRPVTTGTNKQSSSEALQPDRRVTVAMERPGQASASGKFSVLLDCGALIWATEDPNLGQPELTIAAPSVLGYENGRIAEPVRFQIRSNYPAFIQRLELSVHRAGDGDLIDPIARIPVDVKAVTEAEWNAELPQDSRLRPGDELVYVLRAYDAEGHWDETQPRKLQLVTPQEAQRSSAQVLEGLRARLGGGVFNADEAMRRSLLDEVFAGNGLRLQNIPIYGSRVRLQGRDVPADANLTINGESYPVDMERKFAAEYLVPIGKYSFDIATTGPDQKQGERRRLEIDVDGHYVFGVGLADVTFSQNRIGGSRDPFGVDRRYDDDIISDGRLAFYGKAKLRGRYLVTAQADTTERDLRHLFDGFTDAYPKDIFRRIDPDLYYPIYGDDSTTHRDVDTMGRFYLRADWDKNQALWGNYQTGLTGTEYSQYSRSLYGAALSWRSRNANAWGDPESMLRAFGSKAETAPGHNEFIGTGGSLYYLRNIDILPGSETVNLEVRDRTTGRVEKRIALRPGTDYDFDAMQGRLLLTRPLSQITRDNAPGITTDSPLGGFEQRLVVDYEWRPSGFQGDQLTAGVRGKQWFGDHLGVGLTYVDESRQGEDYRLMGGDVTLRAGNGTYVKAEYAQTESSTAPVFFSDNGGFTFDELTVRGVREGEAKSVEARANLKELGWTGNDWSMGAWWRNVGAGYSLSRYPTGKEITEYGAELMGQITPAIGVYARYSHAETGADALTQAQAVAEWRISDTSALTGEIRRVQEERSANAAAGVLGALKYTQRIGTAWDLYGIAQVTLDDDKGRYADNDAFTLGGKYLYGDVGSLGAEISTGDRGDAAQVNAEYRISPEHTFYGAYTFSTDAADYHPLFNPERKNGWTLGQRWRLSNQVNLFNESQFLKERNQTGLAHTFGLDFYPAYGWTTGLTLQKGELESSRGQVDRSAISLRGGYTSPDTDWQSKLEWRRDTGAEQREQWVTTTRLTHKFNESWRIAARLNYADTDDRLQSIAGAKLIEGNFGFAYRPWNSQRWGLFGRYTYLYDLATLGQEGGAQVDQRSQIVSLEGVYKHNRQWEYAAKVARREGEVRMQRGRGQWFDSATTFAALQTRYDLSDIAGCCDAEDGRAHEGALSRWHALAEYRWLDVDNGGTRSGFLVGVDRDIGRHFRIGLGYNFTDFSDDLTQFDYDYRGWFVNINGRY